MKTMIINDTADDGPRRNETISKRDTFDSPKIIVVNTIDTKSKENTMEQVSAQQDTTEKKV